MRRRLSQQTIRQSPEHIKHSTAQCMITLHGVRSVRMRDGRACILLLLPDIGLARWVIRERGRGGGWAGGWAGTDANRYVLRWVNLILILLFATSDENFVCKAEKIHVYGQIDTPRGKPYLTNATIRPKEHMRCIIV